MLTAEQFASLFFVGAIILFVVFVFEMIRMARFRKLSYPGAYFGIEVGNLALLLLGAIGLTAAFQTTHESNRSSARQYISDNSNYLAQMETSIDQILCVYDFGPATVTTPREGCGQEIFGSGGRLSATFDDIQLYIEETLLFFIESKRVERLYGADFYGGLNYWREDLQADSTGAVSYYILSREVDQRGSLSNVDPQSVACLEAMAGIEIDNMCTGYIDFLERLGLPSSRDDRRACGRLNNLGQLRDRARREERVCERTWWRSSFATN